MKPSRSGWVIFILQGESILLYQFSVKKTMTGFRNESRTAPYNPVNFADNNPAGKNVCKMDKKY